MITPEYCQNYLNRISKKYRLGIKPLLLFYRYKKYSSVGSADSDNNEIRINLRHLKKDTLAEVRDTLRHELAHLKADRDGSNGHDGIFKKWAKRLKVGESGFKY